MTASLLDTLTNRSDQLLRELEVPEPPAQEPTGPTQGMFAGLDESIRLLIELGKTYGPYLGYVLWMMQLLVTRKLAEVRRRHKLFVTATAGILLDRRMDPADIEKSTEMAAEVLRKLGLREDRIERGAKEVVALLLTEFTASEQDEVGEEFSRVLALAKSNSAWRVKEQPYGCSIQLPTSTDNKGWAYLISKKGGSGGRLVEILSVCGKADPDNYRVVLAKSSRLQDGTFALRSVGGKEHFVVQEILRLEQVTLPELQRLVPFLARKAEELREDLGLSL